MATKKQPTSEAEPVVPGSRARRPSHPQRPEPEEPGPLRPLPTSEEEAMALVVDAMRRGASAKVALDLLGPFRAELKAALKMPVNPREQHFAHLALAAQAQWKLDCLEAIRLDKQWTSKAWLLERSAPEDYALKFQSRTEVVQVGTPTPESEIERLTEEQIRQEIARLDAALPGAPALAEVVHLPVGPGQAEPATGAGKR